MKRSILLILSLFFAVVIKADITVGDNQMWWGYFNESDADKLSYDGNLGYSKSCTIDAAIRIPASEDIVSGSTIKAIRLWLGNDISAISSGMRLWISTTCPTASTVRADYRQTILKSKLTGGLNEFELTTPFEVNHQDIYVGFTFSISKKTYPVMSYGSDVSDSFYYRIDNGDWENLYGEGYGKLALQVLVESESFPTHCVTVADFGQNVVLKGKSISIPMVFINKGLNPVTSIAYTVSSEDGSTSAETSKTFTASPMALGGSKTYNITFKAEEDFRKCRKTVTVTKVNGEPNAATVDHGTGFLISLSEKQPVTPVIEEFTGTWCGWCPRGMVGMEKIHDYYGDQVVQIAAHYSDIMQTSAYSTVISAYAGGFPSSIIDRQTKVDPSYSSLKNALTSALKRVSLGSIQLSAVWENAEQKAVVFNTKTKFSYNEDSGQYAIAFVLVEDGLTGTGSDWAQQNYYNGQSGSDEMAFWYTAGSPVTGLEFNHVAVAAWDAKNGVNGSVNPRINVDEEQTFRYVGSISTNSLIQDKSKLKAIALLIDRTSNTVVNAAQSPINNTTPLDEIIYGTTHEAERYTLNGQKVSAPQRGINIIRMSDGTVRKVLVK